MSRLDTATSTHEASVSRWLDDAKTVPARGDGLEDAILAVLALQEASPGKLAEHYRVALADVEQTMHALGQYGLISRGGGRRWRITDRGRNQLAGRPLDAPVDSPLGEDPIAPLT